MWTNNKQTTTSFQRTIQPSKGHKQTYFSFDTRTSWEKRKERKRE